MSWRNTVTFDDDVAVRLRRFLRKHHKGFKEAVNEVMRRGLDALETPSRTREPFRTRVFDPGGLIDPTKSIKDILREMDEEYDRKKLGLDRATD